MYWVDVSCINDRLAKLKPWQRINHFPGMTNIARKNRMAQNLERMRREFPKEYSFYPRTWVLPTEMADFRNQFDAKTGKSSKFYIVKPDSGCQGRGIFLTQCVESISPFEQLVAQHYIRKPYLLDGFKFDLRLYVLISSCKPLRMYLFRDGLVRLCTEEYTKPTPENVNMRCMHLTNYAINKHSENFKAQDAGDAGSKRSLSWFMEHIAAEKGKEKAEALWRRMGAMCVKVIIAILPTLVRDYEDLVFKDSGGNDIWAEDGLEGSRCFELLGVDVIIDHALKPWLVEVNHLPSFATDSPLDADIKSRVVRQTIAMIKAKAADRLVYETSEKNRAAGRLYAPPPPPPPKAHTDVLTPAAVAQLRRRIEEIFRKYDPDKLTKVNSLMTKYAGREGKLFRLIEKKYTRRDDGDGSVDPREVNEEVTTAVPESKNTATPTPVDTPVDTVASAANRDLDENDEDYVPTARRSECDDGDHTDSEVEREDEVLVDFDRIYPIPRAPSKRHANVPSYAAQITYVFDQDNKRFKRLYLPLRHNSINNTGDTLPPLPCAEESDGRIPWGDPFKRAGGGNFPSRPASLPDRKPLPMPGQKQVAAADRLTKGFSSARPSSSSGPGSVLTGNGVHPEGDSSQLVSVKVPAVVNWRQQVALQPKTFLFDSKNIACAAFPAEKNQSKAERSKNVRGSASHRPMDTAPLVVSCAPPITQQEHQQHRSSEKTSLCNPLSGMHQQEMRLHVAARTLRTEIIPSRRASSGAVPAANLLFPHKRRNAYLRYRYSM